MVSGDLYLGWVCENKSCRLVIAIALAQAGSEPASAEYDDQLAAIKCPHCGDEDLYRWTRSERKYTGEELMREPRHAGADLQAQRPCS
jgi:hypothetical protein